MSKKPEIDSPITLTVDQIGSEQTPVGRRSAMKVLGAAVLGAGATGVARSASVGFVAGVF